MFKANFSLAESERVLVLTDVPTMELWRSLKTDELGLQVQRSLLARYVKEIGEECFPRNSFRFFPFRATGLNGSEPVAAVGEELLKADVALALTSYSITHTKARNTATSAGVRVASMPGFTVEMFYEGGVMAADYLAIAEKTKRIRNVLEGVSTVEIGTETGTHLSFSIKGRPKFAETGLIEKYNKACNLPAGEAACSPIEGTANGTLVVEKGWHKFADRDTRIEVSDGFIGKIEGSEQFEEMLNDILRPGSHDEPYRSRRNIAEFGIGTNPNAKRPDITLEAEKIEGTIHIGYGNNFFMGGIVNSDYHSDFVIPSPTVVFDGKVFMEKGKIVSLE
jgi:aminopeptidase